MNFVLGVTNIILFLYFICACLSLTGPAIVDLATSDGWAGEFMASDDAHKASTWAAEFEPAKSAVSAHDVKWASEYLEHSEHREW